MKNQLQRILKFNNFFKVQSINDVFANYTLEKPSKILMQNIYSNWLQSIYTKTQKHFPVFKNESSSQSVPFGYISSHKNSLDQEFHHYFNHITPSQHLELQFNLVVETQDILPYFFQWQRYRKYWWSSITTTPSLFDIDDSQHNKNSAVINIVAKFPWGPEIVENLFIKYPDENKENTSLLSCNTTLEGALIILLLDATINSSKDEFLNLHRKVAPYKISFALSSKDNSKEKDLKELATILHHNLERGRISSLLPDFTLPIDEQLRENLMFGVIYTAILSDSTLSDGIFHLFNSSTTLTVQAHVADFQSYATLIFRK